MLEKIMAHKEPWKEFNLGERNPDQGGGLLYCLRYTPERLYGHQLQVKTALDRFGVTFHDISTGIGVRKTKPLSTAETKIVFVLLEELSCINEGVEYMEIGFGEFTTVNELEADLKQLYYSTLTRNLVDAHQLVSIDIPQIVRDLRSADMQNKVLSRQERKSLESLAAFTIEKERQLGRQAKPVVVFGQEIGARTFH